MNPEPKYRIRQFQGRFTVAKEIVRTKGLLWWKKSERGFSTLNQDGQVIEFLPDILKEIPPAEFSTLREAKQFVKGLRRGVIFHDNV